MDLLHKFELLMDKDCVCYLFGRFESLAPLWVDLKNDTSFFQGSDVWGFIDKNILTVQYAGQGASKSHGLHSQVCD